MTLMSANIRSNNMLIKYKFENTVLINAAHLLDNDNNNAFSIS